MRTWVGEGVLLRKMTGKGGYRIQYKPDAGITPRHLQEYPQLKLLAAVTPHSERAIPCYQIGDYPDC